MAKILIVDDLQTEAQLMRVAMISLGHQCIHVTSGEDGVDAARREMPSLILLDIVLPGMDGFQTCRKIKKDPETAHIPIILCSSKTQDSDKFWGLKQGAAAYVTKPFTTESLAAAVKQIIR